MEYKVIIFLMILISVALGMFVGRFVLPRPSGGELIYDTSDPVKDRWLIKLHDAPERLTRKHQVILDVVHRRINEGDPKWPNET